MVVDSSTEPLMLEPEYWSERHRDTALYTPIRWQLVMRWKTLSGFAKAARGFWQWGEIGDVCGGGSKMLPGLCALSTQGENIMKSKAVALGHPIHPMLIPFPLAFLTGAVLFDAAGWFRDLPSWWTTGGHLSVAGIATALLAAIPGLIDYLYTVPPDSSGKARATKHMLANLTAVALFGAAWWIRGGATTQPDAIVLGLEVLGLGLLGAGGYMGGTLVTRNLIGVDHRYAQAGKWREEIIDARKDEAVTVARRDELEVDQMKLLRVGHKRIVLARTEKGYVAFDDRCTHTGGSLAGGVMMCGTVQCLWHGSQFDVSTGRVKAGPAKKKIAVYRLKEEDGDVRLIL